MQRERERGTSPSHHVEIPSFRDEDDYAKFIELLIFNITTF